MQSPSLPLPSLAWRGLTSVLQQWHAPPPTHDPSATHHPRLGSSAAACHDQQLLPAPPDVTETRTTLCHSQCAPRAPPPTRTAPCRSARLTNRRLLPLRWICTYRYRLSTAGLTARRGGGLLQIVPHSTTATLPCVQVAARRCAPRGGAACHNWHNAEGAAPGGGGGQPATGAATDRRSQSAVADSPRRHRAVATVAGSAGAQKRAADAGIGNT